MASSKKTRGGKASGRPSAGTPNPFDVRSNKPLKRQVVGLRVKGAERNLAKKTLGAENSSSSEGKVRDERFFKEAAALTASSRRLKGESRAKAIAAADEEELSFQRLKLLRAQELQRQRREERRVLHRQKRVKKSFALRDSADEDASPSEGEERLGETEPQDEDLLPRDVLVHGGKPISQMTDQELRDSAAALVSLRRAEADEDLDRRSAEGWERRSRA